MIPFVKLQTSSFSFFPSLECPYKHIAASVGSARCRNDVEVVCQRNKVKKNFASRWRQCGVECAKKSRKILEKDADEGGLNATAGATPGCYSKLVSEVWIKGGGPQGPSRAEHRSLRFTGGASCHLQCKPRFLSSTSASKRAH